MEIKKLHQREEWLINQIRNKYKYGEITVVIQDGIPQYIRKGFVNDRPEDNYEREIKGK